MHPHGTLYCSHSVARWCATVWVNVYSSCIFMRFRTRVLAHAFHPPPPSAYVSTLSAYVHTYIGAFISMVENPWTFSHLPLTTPLRHEQRYRYDHPPGVRVLDSENRFSFFICLRERIKKVILSYAQSEHTFHTTMVYKDRFSRVLMGFVRILKRYTCNYVSNITISSSDYLI